jgi:DNA segregation ATPase FtsK/SpoIIIE-like protein
MPARNEPADDNPFLDQTPPARGTVRSTRGVTEQPSLFEQIEELRSIDSRDELFDDAVQAVIDAGRGSVSLLQRKLRVGYSRASRLVDQLEEAGVIGPDQGGSLGREVLINGLGELGDGPQLRSRPAPPPGGTPLPAPRIIGGEDEDPPDGKPRIWL